MKNKEGNKVNKRAVDYKEIVIIKPKGEKR